MKLCLQSTQYSDWHPAGASFMVATVAVRDNAVRGSGSRSTGLAPSAMRMLRSLLFAVFLIKITLLLLEGNCFIMLW